MPSCPTPSACRKYMADAGATVQFCLAHLIREVRFLVDSLTAHFRHQPTPSLMPAKL